jgi:hypothetical protein
MVNGVLYFTEYVYGNQISEKGAATYQTTGLLK